MGNGLLGQADGWTIGLGIAGLVQTIFMSIIAWVVTGLQRRVTDQQKTIEDKTEQLVDQKVALRANVQDVRIEQICKRLEAGDMSFDKFSASITQAAVAVANERAELQKFMLTTFATKEDFAAMNERIDGLQNEVRSLQMEHAAKCGRGGK